MDASQWISVIGLGMLVGATGQLIRAVSGIAKINREQTKGSKRAEDNWNNRTFLLCLLIGATAGAVAAIAMSSNLNASISSSSVIAILGAGYAGADFIEGFVGHFFQGVPMRPPNQPGSPLVGPQSAGPSAQTLTVAQINPQTFAQAIGLAVAQALANVVYKGGIQPAAQENVATDLK